MPLSIHNTGNQGSRRFVWPWRRFCNLLKDCRIVARPMPFAFRARLLEVGAERILFDKILSALRDKKLAKSRTRQRTDSTHVLATVETLKRMWLQQFMVVEGTVLLRPSEDLPPSSPRI